MTHDQPALRAVNGCADNAVMSFEYFVNTHDQPALRAVNGFTDNAVMSFEYFVLLYTYKKYPLILPIFLHKNTESCITLLAFSDSVSPSSIFYPCRTT